MTFDFRRIALGLALILGLAVPLADGPASAAAPRARLVPIRIVGFECGDNCYLSYHVLTATGRRATRDPRSALCNVGPCAAWFEQQAMPSRYVGRRACMVLGKGQQVDGDGNVMSTDFPAIKKLVLDPVK